MTKTLEMTQEKFSLKFDPTLTEATLSIRGTVSVPQPTALNGFFDQAHAQLRATEARGMTLDIRELEFINSTGFKPLIYWLNQVLLLPEANQYKVRILSNGQRRWQASSLSALRSFAPALITIEVS